MTAATRMHPRWDLLKQFGMWAREPSAARCVAAGHAAWTHESSERTRRLRRVTSDVCAHTHMMMDADLTGGMVDRLMDGMRENVIMCEDVMEMMCVSCVTLSETRRASPSGRELVSVWIVIRVMCAAERGGAFWCVSLFASSRVCAPRAVCPGLG